MGKKKKKDEVKGELLVCRNPKATKTYEIEEKVATFSSISYVFVALGLRQTSSSPFTSSFFFFFPIDLP